MTSENPLDRLREVADSGKRQIVKAREAYDDFNADFMESINEALGEMENVDFDSLGSDTATMAGVAEKLVALKLFDPKDQNELETTAGWLGLLAEQFGGKQEGLQRIAEAFDELGSALDSFEDLKDTDNYEGKRDDLEDAWNEVTSSIEELAEAVGDCEDLDLDEVLEVKE